MEIDDETYQFILARLTYISSPTMGLPPGRDAREFAMETPERTARYALQLCIDNARLALKKL